MSNRCLASLIVLFTTLILSPSLFAYEADDILGVWQHVEKNSDDTSQITVYKCGEKYCGKISRLKNPEALDVKNPDESKRSRKLLGSLLFWNVVYDGDGEYEDGRLYASDKGREVGCNLEMKGPDKMYLEGCVAFLCGGADWIRVKQ